MATASGDTLTGTHVRLPADVATLLEGLAPPLAPAEVRWAAPTATTIDTGAWLVPGRLHVMIGPRQVVVAAPGPRPFVRVLSTAEAAEAVYNHVTGELVFPAATGIPGLGLHPLSARELLGRLAAA